MVDPMTAMQDLMAPRLPPVVFHVAKGAAIVRRVLEQATGVPTVATTPKAPNNAFNTPHGAMANHAYAICGLRRTVVKTRPTWIVKLSSDEDEYPLEHFVDDFDTIVTLQRP